MKSKTKLIREIAQQTGISLATAYRAVNSPHAVAEETRRRVLKVLEERNVSIDRRPRSARRAKADTRTTRVAFLVPQMPFPTVEMISEEMMQGMQRVFTPRGIEFSFRHYVWDKANAATTFTSLLNGDTMDGVLLRPPSDKALVTEFCRGRRVVLLGNGFPELDISTVVSDDESGIHQVMEYLFELGHRRIAFASLSPHMMIYRRRQDAYVAEMFRRGIAPDERLIKLHDHWVTPVDEHKNICDRYLRELFALDDPPTAIVCTSDSFAAGLALAARSRGLRVPDDLSLVGYGNQYFAALADPPITTIHVDQRAVGEVAALQLMQMIDGHACPSLSLIRPRFVERRSCARVAG